MNSVYNLKFKAQINHNIKDCKGQENNVIIYNKNIIIDFLKTNQNIK